MTHHRRIALLCLGFYLATSATKARGSSSSESKLDKRRDESSDGADDDDGDARVNCKGRGDRYCYKSWEEDDCPRACEKCEDGRRMRSKMWSAIRNRDYDQVFARSDKVCVARCKNGKRRCGKRVSYKGARYCLAIRCEVGEVEGCHSGDDFDEPSCEACEILFPRACKGRNSDDDDDDSSDDDDDSSEKKRRTSSSDDDSDDSSSEKSSDESDSSSSSS